MTKQRLAGKTALITGGRQGIGRAIVDVMVAEGANVMTCGRGSRPTDLTNDVFWLQTDVSDHKQIAALAAAVEREFGELSILVNNAGVQVEKTVLESSDSDWDAVVGVNCQGVFLCCRELIPLMTQGGSVINIGSISGRVADPGMALYNASKAFVHGLTRSIAVDHGDRIRCNAILPGWIMTGMADAAFSVASDPAAAKKDALARHPTGRFGQPEDIAKIALWLASDEADFANGQCFTVDGGMTAASPLNPALY